jgi:hypothetical protein
MVATASDEKAYHLLAVRQIRAHWPKLDLDRDSVSAISPGYHYVLAGLSFITGDGRRSLRFVTWSVSLALLWLLWRLFPVTRRELALAALLPLAFSNFFVKSASWIMTDNPALFCTAATLALCFRGSDRSVWASAALAGTATFFRQMNVWTAFPVAFQTFSKETKSKRCLAILASLLPLAVVSVLIWHWHGVVPPSWQNRTYQSDRTSASAAVCYILSVFFVLGIFYWLAIPSENRRQGNVSRWALLGGAGGGLLLALASRTDYNVEAGRWGGYLWEAAARFPLLGGRSVVFIVLAPCGGALLAIMTSALVRCGGRQMAALWLGSYGAWAATFLPNRQIFHRYYEPNTLMFLIFWLILFLRHSPDATFKRPLPLLALGAAQLTITFCIVYPETYGRPLFRSH